jgi:hypothetical protein
VSTLQEIQAAVTSLSKPEELKLIAWIHSRHAHDGDDDPELAASIERGTRQLDAGEGIPLQEVRKLARTWTSK